MPEAINAAIELHDSRLGSAELAEGGLLRVRLAPAYIHRSEGVPGLDEGFGETQECVLVFDAGQIQGNVGKLPTDVFSGDLEIGPKTFLNMIPLPCEAQNTAIKLSLFLAPDNRMIEILGQGLVIEQHGHPTYIEPFRSGL